VPEYSWFVLRTPLAQIDASSITLGALEPEMPSYDASKHEPIEEIEL
jgi:hypothetical protein